MWPLLFNVHNFINGIACAIIQIWPLWQISRISYVIKVFFKNSGKSLNIFLNFPTLSEHDITGDPHTFLWKIRPSKFPKEFVRDICRTIIKKQSCLYFLFSFAT